MKLTIRGLIETLGVSAVVVSLLFVGYELRLARSIAESEGYAQAAELNLSLSEYISNNAELWLRGCMDAELSLDEEVVFTNIALAVLGYQFTRWGRSRIGISDLPPRSGPRLVARNRYNYPGINGVWESRGRGSAEFREAVDEEYELLLESNTERPQNAVFCGK